jgi:hypothetical protein
MVFVTLVNRLPEDDTDASKHVEVLRIYKILFIYIYMYVCVCMYVCMYVVHLLVWIINCTKCTVRTSKCDFFFFFVNFCFANMQFSDANI